MNYIKEKYQSFIDYYNKNKLLVNILLLTVFGICSFITQSMTIVLILVASAIILTSNENDGVMYILMLCPFTACLRMFDVEVTIVSLAGVWALKYFVLKLKNKQIKFSNPITICCLVLILYFILPFGPYNIYKLAYTGFYILFMILISIFWQDRNNFNLKQLTYTLTIALIISVIFAPIADNIPNCHKFMPECISSNFVRNCAMLGNPNVFSIICVLCASMLATILLKEKTLKPAIFLVLMLFIGFTSFSKTYVIVAAILAMFTYLYLLIEYKGKYKKQLIRASIVLTCLIFILGLIFIIKRTGTDGVLDISTLTTGRTDIWAWCIAEMSKTPLTIAFGYGMGIWVFKGEFHSAHNLYVEILYRLGVFGTCIVLAILIFFVFTIKKQMKGENVLKNLVPIIMFAIYAMSETFLTVYTIFLVPFCIAFLAYDNEKCQNSTQETSTANFNTDDLDRLAMMNKSTYIQQ